MQLVQLQTGLAKIQATGTQVVAVSYDPVPALAAFADKKHITYPLLSDPDSKVIAAYGVLNQEARGKLQKGIAHPVTFLLDQNGAVRARLFHGVVQRASVDEIIRAAQSIP